jgi:hypothetical protein
VDDRLGLMHGVGMAGEAGKVPAGQREHAEEQRGALVADAVAGDQAEQLVEGALQRGAVFRQSELERGVLGGVLSGGRHGFLLLGSKKPRLWPGLS